jgi:hypothetical protein
MATGSTETIAEIFIPDTALVREITDCIRDAEQDLLFQHSGRIFLFGVLRDRRRGVNPDLELLYVEAMFHDPGVPEFLEPEIALVDAGVETDVVGIGCGDISAVPISAVSAAQPRPDFINRFLAAFNDGMMHRTRILQHFDPTHSSVTTSSKSSSVAAGPNSVPGPNTRPFATWQSRHMRMPGKGNKIR